MFDVKLGGVWLRSLGHVGAVKWSSSYGSGPSGPALASCTLAIDPSNNLSSLRIGAAFEVWADGVLEFGGPVTEIGRGFPRAINAKGWARRSEDFDAVDGSGNPTTNPRTAVTNAIANGMEWSNATAFANTSLGTDGAPTTQRVSSLLSQFHSTTSERYGADERGVAFVTTDPTEPSWYLNASDLDLGVAADGLFTRVRARYVSSIDIDGNPDGWDTEAADDLVAQAEFGVIEYAMDLTGLGLLSSGDAADYAEAQLALLTVPQWLSRVTTNSARLLTPGGLPAHLPSVRAGQMVRLFNVPQSLGGIQSELGRDVVLGEVEYDTENPTEITLAPVGLAVRSLADLAAQSKRAAVAVTDWSTTPVVTL